MYLLIFLVKYMHVLGNMMCDVMLWVMCAVRMHRTNWPHCPLVLSCSTNNNWLKKPKYLIYWNPLLTLQCMKEHGVWNFIFSSSATVYGMPNCLPIREDHSVGDGITNPYGRSKFFIEQIIQDLCKAEKVKMI